MIGAPTPMPPQASPPLSMTHVSVDLTRAPALFLRYSGAIAAALSICAGLLLLSAATVIAVLHLPWLLLGAPAAFGAALLGIAVAIVLRARKRLTTGGLDPDVERRILDVAMACQGRVTVMAVARGLAMPLAEADAALTALARSGHVAVDNDPATGVLVYVFPDVHGGAIAGRSLR